MSDKAKGKKKKGHQDWCSEGCKGQAWPPLRGIDVNRLPSEVDCEEEAGISSLNSTISSVSGKRSDRDHANNSEENDTDRAYSRGIGDEEDNKTSRKKLRLSKDQSEAKVASGKAART
ncbi:hypothetical protein K1719_020985 [Acacia pycnantha]|nr:hypothetical protein K1719_020985 [Acacia pycnantha]